MSKRTGALLIQLGTPNAPTSSAVRPYLRQFLMDPRVIDIPWLLRWLLVNLIIAPFRAPKSAKLYEELWERSADGSPLLSISQDLVDQINAKLENSNTQTFLAMRYGDPGLETVLKIMQRENFDKLLIIPMYPHYASSSTGTAVQKSLEIISKWWVIPELEVVGQFYDQDYYLDALISQARKHDLDEFDHILMSYHGLPVRHVDKVYPDTDLCENHNCEESVTKENGLCYKAAVYETSRLLAAKLDISSEDYTVAFQSRLNQKWLTPFADDTLVELAKAGKRRLLVFSPAFVADCLETLVEIESEFAEIFTEHGGESITLVKSCNTEPVWVDGLANVIRTKSV